MDRSFTDYLEEYLNTRELARENPAQVSAQIDYANAARALNEFMWYIWDNSNEVIGRV